MITLTGSRQVRQILRAARQERGLTLRELARSINVSVSGVSKREQGHGSMHVEALIDHAAGLGYRVALLPGEPEFGRSRPADTDVFLRSTGTGWPT